MSAFMISVHLELAELLSCSVLRKPHRQDDISLHIIQIQTEAGDISTEGLPHLKSLIVRLRLIYPWVHYAAFLGFCGIFLFRYIFF